MKRLLLFLFLIPYCINLFGQELPIKFQATEEANPWIGKEWDFTFTEMRTPMNISFDGKVLKMIYKTGQVYLEKPVLKYERKEKKNYDKVEGILYILQIQDQGYITYWIIEKRFTLSDEINITLKKPFITSGEVMSYYYYLANDVK